MDTTFTRHPDGGRPYRKAAPWTEISLRRKQAVALLPGRRVARDQRRALVGERRFGSTAVEGGKLRSVRARREGGTNVPGEHRGVGQGAETTAWYGISFCRRADCNGA